MDNKETTFKEQENNKFKDEFFMRRVFKKPYVLIPVGIILLIPALYSIFFNFTVVSVLFYVPIALLGLGLLFGGILRIIRN
ncbi:hypothetical protein IAI10_08835 [Clostridium sp. 19966]|uniref:hypothetical protein n=1 Tax=Clostridium sp. 19966 TaxID=2768166 RepID=UPI0028DD5E3F|nr:hypothetical protein [Clostridium sp. 19966]MDT8716762.1 hypothetical protein [Clostridium sp. 19966]